MGASGMTTFLLIFWPIMSGAIFVAEFNEEKQCRRAGYDLVRMFHQEYFETYSKEPPNPYRFECAKNFKPPLNID
jgi:hypothetical protein